VTLRRPRVMRTLVDAGEPVWEWWFPADLLRLLMHPLAGGTQPLGRRHHPLGRIVEGMAIHATLAMTGALPSIDVAARMTQPVRGDADFRVRARMRMSSATARRVDNEIFEGDRPVARVRVGVADPDATVVGARPST
jgi:hypothetical protein